LIKKYLPKINKAEITIQDAENERKVSVRRHIRKTLIDELTGSSVKRRSELRRSRSDSLTPKSSSEKIKEEPKVKLAIGGLPFKKSLRRTNKAITPKDQFSPVSSLVTSYRESLDLSESESVDDFSHAASKVTSKHVSREPTSREHNKSSKKLKFNMEADETLSPSIALPLTRKTTLQDCIQ